VRRVRQSEIADVDHLKVWYAFNLISGLTKFPRLLLIIQACSSHYLPQYRSQDNHQHRDQLQDLAAVTTRPSKYTLPGPYIPTIHCPIMTYA
jgi:hypothetical protein